MPAAVIKKEDDSIKINDFVRRKIVRHFDKTVLPELAAKRLSIIRQEEMSKKKVETIYDVFDLFSKEMQLERPYHLQPLVDILEKGMKTDVESVIHAPPQHGKSTLALVALLLACLTLKNRKHIYVTYNEDQAGDVADSFVRLCRDIGLVPTKRNNVVYLIAVGSKSQRNNNQVRFTSIKGGVTGKTVTGLAIIDDPIKGAEAAKSPTQQKAVWKFYTEELMTRKSKEFSVFCIMTRWDVQDLSGRLIKENKYPYLRLAAICDDPKNDPMERQLGEALWPDNRPIKMLEDQKDLVGDRVFESMYQGNPVIDGDKPFEDLVPTQENPRFSNFMDWVTVYGMDLGYTSKKGSDNSVIVKFKTNKKTGMTYVVDCLYGQELYDVFFERFITTMYDKDPARIIWHCSSLEHGAVTTALKQSHGHAQLIAIKTNESKYNRAVKSNVIDDFNQDKIRLLGTPTKGVSMLMNSLREYVPYGKTSDDFMDALVSGYGVVNHYWRRLVKDGDITINREQRQTELKEKCQTRKRMIERVKQKARGHSAGARKDELF